MPVIPTAEEMRDYCLCRFEEVFKAPRAQYGATFRKIASDARIKLTDELCTAIVTASHQLAEHLHSPSRGSYKDAKKALEKQRDALRVLISANEALVRCTGTSIRGDDLPNRELPPTDVLQSLESARYKRGTSTLKVSDTLTKELKAIEEVLNSWNNHFCITGHRPLNSARGEWLKALADIFTAAGGAFGGEAKQGAFHTFVRAVNLAMHDCYREHSDDALNKRTQRFVKNYKPGKAIASGVQQEIGCRYFSALERERQGHNWPDSHNT